MKNWHLADSLESLVIGRAHDLSDQRLFHKVSLVAVLACVGLGADGLSSSCYGPEESFKALGAHTAHWLGTTGKWFTSISMLSATTLMPGLRICNPRGSDYPPAPCEFYRAYNHPARCISETISG